MTHIEEIELFLRLFNSDLDEYINIHEEVIGEKMDSLESLDFDDGFNLGVYKGQKSLAEKILSGFRTH